MIAELDVGGDWDPGRFGLPLKGDDDRGCGPRGCGTSGWPRGDGGV